MQLSNYVPSRVKLFFKRREKFDNTFLIDDLLDNLDIEQNSILFLHAGLKRMKQKTNKDYGTIVDEIINVLKKKYNPHSIIAPAFTPSFRETRVFSVNHSKSEVGAFSELFRQRADYRTSDPIHSVSIITNNLDGFKRLNFSYTFSRDGVYGYLNKPNSFIINISTGDFVSIQMHYIEEICNVAYKNRTHNIFSGVIFDYEDRPIKCKQINHAYNIRTQFNRKRIVNCLKKEGALKERLWKKIKVSYIRTELLHKILEKGLKENEYFLVS